jgi:predicted acetyltransferase
MNKLQKEVHKAVNKKFIICMSGAFYKRFGVGLRVSWNIWHTHIMSWRVDGVPLTAEQKQFIDAYELGFVAALEIVDECDAK